jgi:hypothetical protein
MNSLSIIQKVFFVSLALLVFSCKEDFSIKPPAKLRLDFPKQEYIDWRSDARFSSQLSKHYQVNCLFNREKAIDVGDVVVVRQNVLKGKGDELGKKITSLGIPIAGKVLELVKGEKVLVEIDLGEEEIEISGVKKSKFNLLLSRNEVKKISQFEPFDIVEEVAMGNLHGDLMIHYKVITRDDSLSNLTKLVVSNVESHKFKSESIDKKPILNAERKMFGMFYEFEGDMATSFQFYVTDSLQHFIWGQVLMDFQALEKEGIPTDSETKSRIRDYIRKDLEVFIDRLNWRK